MQIVFQTGGHDISLRHDFYILRHILSYLGDKDGVVGAPEKQSVDKWVGFHDGIYIFLYEIIGTVGICFAVFYERHPHWASHFAD